MTVHPEVPQPSVAPMDGENPLFDQTIPSTDQSISDASDKAKEKVGGTFRKLGQNRQARSGVRPLLKADREAIEQLYIYSAMAVMQFRPLTAQAMAENSGRCADAWVELASKNDNVRRAILALIEGGAWSGIFLAHTPILLTMIPDNIAARFAAPTDAPDDQEG